MFCDGGLGLGFHTPSHREQLLDCYLSQSVYKRLAADDRAAILARFNTEMKVPPSRNSQTWLEFFPRQSSQNSPFTAQVTVSLQLILKKQFYIERLYVIF